MEFEGAVEGDDPIVRAGAVAGAGPEQKGVKGLAEQVLDFLTEAVPVLLVLQDGLLVFIRDGVVLVVRKVSVSYLLAQFGDGVLVVGRDPAHVGMVAAHDQFENEDGQPE